MTEQHFTFPCAGHELVGCLHRGSAESDQGVLIVVGGPQYKAGSHRQFVLLARKIASAGHSVLRFDYRGMGDSSGPAVAFTEASADILAAIDAFKAGVPTLKKIVLYGLCDGASALLMHAASHPDVVGLILVNPWVSRDEQSSDARIRFYYAKRLLDRAFWKKLFTGRVAVFRSIWEFAGVVRASSSPSPASGSFRDAMVSQLTRFSGRVLVVLSGNDIVAAEFDKLLHADAKWENAIQNDRTSVVRMAAANHTMSRKDWEEDLFSQVGEWLETQ